MTRNLASAGAKSRIHPKSTPKKGALKKEPMANESGGRHMAQWVFGHFLRPVDDDDHDDHDDGDEE